MAHLRQAVDIEDEVLIAGSWRGILLYRGHGCGREVFLVHPGGTFWTKRDEGALVDTQGSPRSERHLPAHREFKEETGFEVGREFHDLGFFRQPSGKLLHIWAVKGDCDPSNLVSNSFEMVLPPKSGRMEWKASQRSIALLVAACGSASQNRSGSATNPGEIVFGLHSLARQ